jgi:hypothetical protein
MPNEVEEKYHGQRDGLCKWAKSINDAEVKKVDDKNKTKKKEK